MTQSTVTRVDQLLSYLDEQLESRTGTLLLKCNTNDSNSSTQPMDEQDKLHSILIGTSSGKTVAATFTASDTVFTLKRKVQDIEGADPSQISLKHNTKLLRNEQLLINLNIPHNDVISVHSYNSNIDATSDIFDLKVHVEHSTKIFILYSMSLSHTLERIQTLLEGQHSVTRRYQSLTAVFGNGKELSLWNTRESLKSLNFNPETDYIRLRWNHSFWCEQTIYGIEMNSLDFYSRKVDLMSAHAAATKSQLLPTQNLTTSQLEHVCRYNHEHCRYKSLPSPICLYSQRSAWTLCKPHYEPFYQVRLRSETKSIIIGITVGSQIMKMSKHATDTSGADGMEYRNDYESNETLYAINCETGLVWSHETKEWLPAPFCCHSGGVDVLHFNPGDLVTMRINSVHRNIGLFKNEEFLGVVFEDVALGDYKDCRLMVSMTLSGSSVDVEDCLDDSGSYSKKKDQKANVIRGGNEILLANGLIGTVKYVGRCVDWPHPFAEISDCTESNTDDADDTGDTNNAHKAQKHAKKIKKSKEACSDDELVVGLELNQQDKNIQHNGALFKSRYFNTLRGHAYFVRKDSIWYANYSVLGVHASYARGKQLAPGRMAHVNKRGHEYHKKLVKVSSELDLSQTQITVEFINNEGEVVQFDIEPVYLSSTREVQCVVANSFLNAKCIAALPECGSFVQTRENEWGVVRFVGQIRENAEDRERREDRKRKELDDYVGIELRHWSPNAGDGSYDGWKYFECELGYGKIVKRDFIICQFGWKMERLIWIGYHKNVTRYKTIVKAKANHGWHLCHLAFVPIDVVKIILSFLRYKLVKKK